MPHVLPPASAVIAQHAVENVETPLFAVYFPSGFDASSSADGKALTWEKYAHARRKEFEVVARTVRRGLVESSACVSSWFLETMGLAC